MSSVYVFKELLIWALALSKYLLDLECYYSYTHLCVMTSQIKWNSPAWVVYYLVKENTLD